MATKEKNLTTGSEPVSGSFVRTLTSSGQSQKTDFDLFREKISHNDYTNAEKTKLAGIETEATKTIVDSALSPSSTNPVQNKVVDAALTDLKSDSDFIASLLANGLTPYGSANFFMRADGTKSTQSTVQTLKYKIPDGLSSIYFSGIFNFSVATPRWCFLWFVDSNGEMISGGYIPADTAAPQQFSFYELTIPAGAAEIWVDKHGSISTETEISGKNYNVRIEDAYHKIENVYGKYNLLNMNDPDIVLNKFISGITGGQPSWSNYNGLFESGYIPVTPGQYYVVYDRELGSVDLTTTAFFDNNKNIISTGYAWDSNKKVHIVPANCFYIRCPGTIAHHDQMFITGWNESDFPLPSGTDFQMDYIPYIPDGYNFGYVYTKLYAAPTENDIDELRSLIASAVSLGSQWQGKTWYAYGTSITNINSEGKYPNYLAAMSGMNLVCKGISGGGIGDLGAYSHGQVYNAICNTTDGKLNADLITLETGANDVDANVPLGTIYDTGRTTLSGCLNDCLRYLQANTDAQIAVTVSPASTAAPNITDKYYEWAAMVEQICYLNRVPFLNGNNNMGYGKISSSKGSMYVVDSIHQTQLGGYTMAEMLWYQIRNIPCFYTSIPN